MNNFVLTKVEYRISGYPGPSKERGKEVRLMRDKTFRGKKTNVLAALLYDIKTIAVKELDPTFVRMKVPELIKYLQVGGFSFPNDYRRYELLGFLNYL